MVTIALVGAGSFARMHLDAYAEAENADVKWVCDPDIQARQTYMDRYGIQYGTADYREALSDGSVDLVDIVAPNHLHKPIAVDAVQAGKHVLCEKPMALTAAEGQEMIDAARAAGRQLHVKYHQRFDPVHRQVKDMWAAGEMPGSVVTVARRMDSHLASMLNPNHWRGIPALTGGGCLFSSGSHTLDLLYYFFGPVVAVTATNRQLVADDPTKADDNATVVLEFDCGMVATFVGCWTVQHIKWTTTEIYSPDSTIRVRSDGGGLVLEREAKGTVDPMRRSDDWFRKSNLEAIGHFLSCVGQDVEPLYPAQDCVNSMRILEAAYRSSDEGRRITLP